MATFFKNVFGAPGPENQPSGEEMIAKLKNRLVDNGRDRERHVMHFKKRSIIKLLCVG